MFHKMTNLLESIRISQGKKLSALVLGTYENRFGKEETLIGSDR